MRLLVPYVTVCSIWVVPWSYCYSKLSISTAISSYLLATNPSQLWFLFMLFWVFVIAILIPKWVYDDCIALGIISILLCGIGLVAGTKIPNVFQIWTAFQYFIFFAIGMMLRRYEGGFVWKIPCYLWIVIDIILFVINYFVGKQHGTVFKITRIGMNLLLHIVGAVMAFTVLNAIANKVNWKQNKVIGFLQKHNFAIYLFHQQVIYGVITLLNGEVPSVILALANFVGAIAVSSLISVILHKWKVTRILIGEKG